MESPLLKPLTVAVIQLACGADKAANLSHARKKVLEAASKGAKLVVLPECFNSPYGCSYFPTYAEPLGNPSTNLPPASKDESPSYFALSAAAKDAGVYLVGGSVPELVISRETGDNKYYNTLLFFGPDGSLLAYHRKLHLFDIDIPGGITFRESDVLSAGSKITVANMPEYGNVMLGICYDVRFPEPAMLAARKQKCFALIYPGAFNMTTGPMHWELLGRARAVDNQTYVVMCSPARDMGAEYHAWGHSFVADPAAKVLSRSEEGEEMLVVEMRPEEIMKLRRGIPNEIQRRFEVYPDITAGQVRWDE